ncbi:MAG: alpha/beta hydrolase [Rhodospirillaceae bacterium]|nr:alpha/beta hydrolase [Rhodospirillaceae bacterium]
MPDRKPTAKAVQKAAAAAETAAAAFAYESLARSDGATIAYRRSARRTADGRPGVVFLGGFGSDMTGTKAGALEAHCRKAGYAFLRFDYTGHGRSSGRFEDGTIGDWSADAILAFDRLTDGPQILIGSSMGGWIMLNLALARKQRVAGLIGIAAAPDFTEELIWRKARAELRDTLTRDGIWRDPDGGLPITMRLIEDGRRHLHLGAAIDLDCPMRLLHGMNDTSVPWQTSTRLAERLIGSDVVVTLIKGGDHRLSEPADLARLTETLDALVQSIVSRSAASPSR